MMQKSRSLSIRLLRWFLLTLILFSGLLLAGSLFLLSSSGQPLLIDWLQRSLKQQQPFQLSFERIYATGARSITIGELSLASSQGEQLLYTPRLTLRFSLMQLLHGRLPLERVQVERLRLNGQGVEQLLGRFNRSDHPDSLNLPSWLLAGHLRVEIAQLELEDRPMEPASLSAWLSWSPLSQKLQLELKGANQQQPGIRLSATHQQSQLTLHATLSQFHRIDLFKQTPLARWDSSNLQLDWRSVDGWWERDPSTSSPALLRLSAETPFGNVSSNLSAQITSDLLFKAEQLELDLAGCHLYGSGSCDPQGHFALELHSDLELLSFQELKLVGGHGQLKVQGDLRQFEAQLELAAESAQLAQIAASVEQLHLKGRFRSQESLDIELLLSEQGQALRWRAEMKAEQGVWVLDLAQASGPGLELLLTSSSKEAGWSLEARLDWQKSELARVLSRQIGIHAGTLEFFAHCNLQNGLYTVDFHTQLAELTFSKWRNALLSSTGRFRANSLTLSEIEIEEVRLKLHDIEHAGQLIAHSLDWTSWGHPGAVFFHVTGERLSRFEDHDISYHLIADGLLDRTGPQVRLTLDDLHGHWSGSAVQLKQSCLFELTSSKLACSDFAIALGDGSLQLDGSWSQEQVLLDSRLTHVPLDLVSLWLQRPLSGEANGQILLNVSPKHSQAEIALQLEALHPQSISNGSPVEGAIQASWRGEQLQMEGSFRQPGGGILRATLAGRWAALCHPESWSEWGVHQPHDLQLQLSGHLGMASRLFVSEEFDFDGLATAQIHSWGQPAYPLFEGTAEISQGSYDHYRVGLKIRHIEAKLHGEGDRLLLDHFSATDGELGQLKAQGQLLFEERLHSTTTIEVKGFHLIETPLASVWATGSSRFNHRGYSAHLEGQLLLDSVKARIPEKLPSSIPTLEGYTLTRWPRDGGSLQGYLAAPCKEDSGLIFFNLELLLSTQAILEGRGLFSSWKGQLHLQGDDEHPLLTGQLRIDQGELQVAGRRFVVREGEVQFAGEPLQNAQIHLTSELALNEATMRALLNGPLSHPQLQLTSNPRLSINDLFSLILFGKTHSSLTPLQTFQVAQLALEVAGESDIDPLGRLRRSTGFDLIELSNRSKEEGQNEIYTLKIGKYLSEGVLVSVSKDVTTQGTQLTLEFDLTRHLSLLAQLGYLSDSSLGVVWKRDY